MTPQEIVDAAATARQRMNERVLARMRAQEEAFKGELSRIQGECARITGHVFGPQQNWMGAPYVACVYCGALPAKGLEVRGGDPDPADVPMSDV